MNVSFTGVHCSISGGVVNAIEEAINLKIDSFQVFTKNQRQWKEKEYTNEEGNVFKNEMEKAGMKVAFSHCTYLLNPASSKIEDRKKSIGGLIGEINRCHILGLPFAVLHPGSNPDTREGIKLAADSLNRAFEATSNTSVKILLENTAGQGNVLGKNFEELMEIINETGKERLGVCFDTCHAYAAGYDISTLEGVKKTFDELDQVIGLDNMLAIHLNDSKGELGKHLDRHEHIGLGNLGDVPFKYIMSTFINIPKVLETPKKDDWDRRNLDKLISYSA